ncbi:serine/threonine-protein kinase [Haloechinothrix salitolerans]|uniref:non-specific serine/threonine protein kinase n=1 Tax=Haloechinothrix salitolerans TaxID=926830 RepID=A0ABW2BVC2_9PSEU
MSEPGDLVAGRYRLQRLLGTGAMGVVWQARDERLNRDIAIKKLLIQPGLEPAQADEARRRAMREGRVAARLHHPHVIGVFDVVVDDDLPVLVMEYLPSRSLAELMSERGRLPAGEVARIGAQAASALAAAHDAGVIHRDVKPANILIAEDGSAKITDFGISHAAGDVVVTQTGLVAGTPAYLAPEVARGTKPSPASDMFSLGATLYAAVEGTPPFGGAGENSLSLLHKVAAGTFPQPQHAGVLIGALQRMMQLDPAARVSAREAEQMLTQAATGHQPTAVLGAWPGSEAPTRAMNPQTLPGVPPVTEYAEPPKRSARRWMVAAIVVALLAGVGLAAYFLLDGDDPGSDAVELTPAAMEQAVADYYDLLPDQAEEAWERLGPALRAQGKQNYLDRWSEVDDVDIVDDPRATGSDTVRVGIELELGDGTVRDEVHSLTLITSPERLLINDDRLLRENETGPTTAEPETVTETPTPTTTETPPTTTTTTQTTTTTEQTTTTTEPTPTTEPDDNPADGGAADGDTTDGGTAEAGATDDAVAGE